MEIKPYRQGFLDSVIEAGQWSSFSYAVVARNKALDAIYLAKIKFSNDLDLNYCYGRRQGFEDVTCAFWDNFPEESDYDKRWTRFKIEILSPYQETVNKWVQMETNERQTPPKIPIKEIVKQVKAIEAAQSYKAPRLVTTRLSDVEAKEIQWFWPNRMPHGMLSILAGNPGVGKSFLTMFMCSRITTGKDWPDAKNTIEPGSVLLFADEESLEYAIKPRLEAHDADCTKIISVDHIQRAGDGLPDTFSVDAHIQLLRAYLDELPDCRLMIFDPITAYLGSVNANSNAEVRGALIGLQNLAQERGITVLGINHFSKKADLDAVHRVLGSMGFVAAARSAWAVVFDKQDEECEDEPARLFMPIKSNYSINPTTLSYNIIDGKVVFDEGERRANIDAIMQKAKKTKVNPNIDKAKEFLQCELDGKAFVLARDVLHRAEAEGIDKHHIYKARDSMGVLTWRDGFGGDMKWSLERVEG